MTRDYGPVIQKLRESISDYTDTKARMSTVVDLLWEAFSPKGVSWVGFYEAAESGTQLVLGPRRDRPACSPIGLHGVCGRAFLEARPVVVDDVTELGDDYIACDPRDRSEVVVPLIDDGKSCRGVLDLDSHQPGAFDASDVTGLGLVLKSAGLSS